MRLPTGGVIDRTQPLSFTLDGVPYTGLAGDTLASAMLANGVVQVAPSLYLRRPRGIFSAGAEEPNALVQVGPEPSLPATTVQLVDGLSARLLSGVGRLVPDPEEPRYDKRYTHTDVLVIGGGPAGRAAYAAARTGGARVTLVSTSDGSTAFGYYDSNYVLVAQGRTLWHIRARRVILATGAYEQPIVFSNNDRPGIMLAGAVRRYITRYAVLPGRQAVVFTTNDSGYLTASALMDAGASVTVVDPRGPKPGFDVVTGLVSDTTGDSRITSVLVGERTIPCDLLAVSGGWNPNVHLFSQSRGTLRWNGSTFVPDKAAQAVRVVGAANGTFSREGAVAEGTAAGAEAAEPPKAEVGPEPVWLVPGDSSAQFVDLARDATVADVERAVGAGMRSPEHVKRYTTIGTGADQGRTSGIVTLGVLATLLGTTPGELGTTTFRAPSVPVSFALMAGRDRGNSRIPCGRPRSTRGTWPPVPSSRTWASGNAPGTTRASART
ncbi:hypothetical protein GCM10029964_123860 [Kibdelosporangium lantanae]